MVEGAVRNGGIYIKLGQGLCSFNHLLPPEYIRTLQVLEDKALNRRYREVSTNRSSPQGSPGEHSLKFLSTLFVCVAGGRALPGGLQQEPGAALQNVRLRAHRRRQPGSGPQGGAVGRDARGGQGEQTRSQTSGVTVQYVSLSGAEYRHINLCIL